ncbi:copper amine oxidase, putative [Phytophthora infestans T30-4]|uniref:Amine oxidase n=1 Tax=Phytophthora infestans (strain T30-4) TaxID=403677 RepID=D0MYC9_PHYIT|nr:copper amine oxidase, putative [Phytophthora infestans T30-4]EEY66177.1 copper amine oxidase, putative [Phytophthora infestans T30-4]|eukprot:XP_002906776.1 copper amine oxidase, putative [Phytophthora infestans T30-4]
MAPSAHPLCKDIKHPLDPVTADEVRTVKQVLADAGYSSPEMRYAYVMLFEPDHATLDKFFEAGQLTEIPREIGVLVLDQTTNVTRDFVVDVVARRIVKEVELDPKTDGQIPILDQDYWDGDSICKADPDYIAALAKRGITDLDMVRGEQFSAGVFGYEGEEGNRMIRVLSFLKVEITHAMYGHPIDGLVAHADLTNRKVLKLVDTGYTHIPMESGDYLDPKITGPMRTDMKPLHIKQPQGLTLHDISFNDRGRKRKILNRASVSEMVVPYGEPSPTHDWQNYFDAGEYQFGHPVLGRDGRG